VRLPCPGFGVCPPLGGGEEMGYAHIDTGHRTGGGEWFGGHPVTGEHDGAPRALPLDADRLDPTFHGPMLVHPDVPHAVQADPGHRVVRDGSPNGSHPRPSPNSTASNQLTPRNRG
jgi:hypothetical protein